VRFINSAHGRYRQRCVGGHSSALLEYVSVSAIHPLDEREGSADAWLWGARAGLDATLKVVRPVELLLGAELTGSNKTLELRVSNAPRGEAAQIRYGFLGRRPAEARMSLRLPA